MQRLRLLAAACAMLALPAVGAAQPTYQTWYLAEGATGTFEEYILVANPNNVDATVDLRVFTDAGSYFDVTGVRIPAASRQTVRVNDYAAAYPQLPANGAAVSVKATSSVPIVVERSMYWGGPSRRGGHNAEGVAAPAPTWYFAEGATGFFDTYVLVSNPNASPATVDLSFTPELGGAPSVLSGQTIQPFQRKTFRVNDFLPNAAFATTVHSTNGVNVIAERAMYWNGFEGGHDAVGVTAPLTTWYFAEGYTGGDFQTFVLLANPGAADATATITYYLTTGATLTRQYTVPAGRRKTAWVGMQEDGTTPDRALRDQSFSFKVTSSQPLVAERAVYWGGFVDGTATAGVGAQSSAWAFAEGVQDMWGGQPFESYFLLMNASASPIDVLATFYGEDGAGFTKNFTIPASSRVTVMPSDLPQLSNRRFATFFQSTGGSTGAQFVAERAVYWGAGWYGGHASTGIPWEGFTIAAPRAGLSGPTISGMSPNTGTANGGTFFTVTGDHFTKGSSITVGGAAVAAANVVDEHTITGFTTGRYAGPADVVVTGVNGSATAAGAFTYIVAGPPPPPPCGAIICDDLQGSSAGQQIGGGFDNFGYVVTSPNAGIIYNMSPTLTSGYLEFEATGISRGVAGAKYELFSMSDGGFTSDDLYRATLEIREADKGVTRLKFLTGDGRDEKVGVSKKYIEADVVVHWNPGLVYKVRLEWGPNQRAIVDISTGGSTVARIDQRYGNADNGGIYNPRNHVIRIGNPGAGDQASLPGVRVRNVRIGSL